MNLEEPTHAGYSHLSSSWLSAYLAPKSRKNHRLLHTVEVQVQARGEERADCWKQVQAWKLFFDFSSTDVRVELESEDSQPKRMSFEMFAYSDS